MIRLLFLTVSFLLTLLSCSLFDSKRADKIDASKVTLVPVGIVGDSSFLGSAADWAAPDEKPVTPVRFGYAFSLGQTEVTQELYRNILGTLPPEVTDSSDLRRPVTWTSYYDAVRFCNALGKSEGLDTVYRYLSMTVSAGGVVSVIQGLQADFSKDGYRLPTEAEWEFAARGNKNIRFPWGDDASSSKANQYAWGFVNSHGSLQPVGTKTASAFGLYDMAGNAMEIVGDWFGPHPDSVQQDFVGPDQPNTSQQIIGKGGGYVHDILTMRISNRKDIYIMQPATRGSYLGFRVARGSIAKPNFASQNGKTAAGNPSHLLATREQIADFFGPSRVRLAFINGINSKLAVVNFFATSPRIYEETATAGIYHPSISPDGAQIAVSTRYEGQNGSSHVFLTNFLNPEEYREVGTEVGAIPRWWIDPRTQDTGLVVASTAQSNADSLDWSQNATRFIIPKAGESFSNLTADGSFHSGISTDGNWLATGYTKLRVLDRRSWAVRTLFQSPQNGKDSLGSSQVCNVSVRPGASPDLLFLDFGYDKTSQITGSAYGVHEELFLADINSGAVRSHWHVPSGYQNWDYTEWSNLPGFAVALLTDQSGAHRVIVALRISDGAILPLVEGDDLWMPALWVSPFDIADGNWIDSLGRYNEPASINVQVYQEKMYRFWSRIDSSDALIFGSSREMFGIVPAHLVGYKALNMAVPGAPPFLGFDFVRNYIQDSVHKLKLIVIGLGPEFADNQSIGYFQQYMATTPGYLFDKTNGFWKQGMSVIERKKMEMVASENSVLSWASPDIPTYLSCNSWGGAVPRLELSHPWDNGSGDWDKSFALLSQFTEDMAKENIKVVALILPMSPAYRNTDYYSLHGGLRTNMNVYLDSVRTLQNRFANFLFLDFNKDGLHDFADAEAYDYDHLCTSSGGMRVTDSLSIRLQEWNARL